MNSAEEISKYKETVDNYYSPTLSRRLLGYGYDLPEKSPKKDKKWSIGSLFRRKKKEESESSSEEEGQKKGFLGRKKKKSEKKKKVAKSVGTFDHVVLSRNSHLYSNGFNGYEEPAIFSDPSGSFNGYGGRALPKSQVQETARKPVKNTSLDDVNMSRSSLVSGSTDVSKKNKKGLAKVRAEARRVNLKFDSSSDEDSQRSASSSRFRSDESLGQIHRDSASSRRSRAARTERYLKRHSRDGENPKDYLRLSKSDAENCALQWKTSDDSNRSLSRSPLVPVPKPKLKTSYSSLSQPPSISGLSTIPPSHGSHNRIRVSNSTSNPSYKPPLSMNDYNNSTRKLSNDYLDNQRSISCDANIHKAPSTEIDPEIIHVQFPLGKPNNRYRNLSLVESRQINAVHARQPPPPPPRDPRRLVTAQYYENVRPNTYYLDGTGQVKSKSFHAHSPIITPPQTKKFNSFNLNPSCRSTSEDCLPKTNIQLNPRPSSATPDTSAPQRYVKGTTDNYNYLMEKKPRSRKPIFIQTSSKSADNSVPDKSGTQKALDFWKQKDREGGVNGTFQDKLKATKSPQIFTCQTHVQTQVFLPSVLQNDINSEKLANSTDSLATNENLSTPVLTNEKSSLGANNDDDRDEDLKRKSTNLEEALDELEAIYNSLRLGDEDLLERAEQREKDAAAKRLKEELKREIYPSWNMSRGALSDSSFSYEPFDSLASPRRKRLIRKSQTIDRRADDMAFRKLNKERAATINDPQSALARISYLNASPVYSRDMVNEPDVPNKNSKEPDITLDDVVYRNVKYAKSSPKVVETQPPFGIPLGPITPAANSDYLHAVPDNIYRPTFKPRKIPDLVKDDLAFRNLRKDQNKEPALAPLSPDDLKNNNACESKSDFNSMKKKRAVRSLSANIGSLINRDIWAKGLEKHKYNNNSENSESSTLTDIADAMEIARQVLKEKENKITATRRAFLSDTDTNNGNDNLAESRMNFLNSLKTPASQNETMQPLSVPDNYLQAKPPRGLTPEKKSARSPKESTPIPVSPLEEKSLRDSSLDDLLTALATEARETNERITNELKSFSEDNGRKKIPQLEDNLDKPRELTKTLSDIDAVSEQAKLCEKLLEGVVDSTDLMASAKPPLEEVEQIDVDPVLVESVANIVLTRGDLKVEATPSDKVLCESDHDYENLISDQELNLEVNTEGDVKCTSPFEEHKAELVATFQELKKNNVDLVGPANNRSASRENDIVDSGKKEKESDDMVAGKHSPRRSRSRLPRWLRPHSSGNLSDPTTMSEGQESRAERIARYKEQRRKELAAQFTIQSDPTTGHGRNGKDTNSSGSEGPRTTRTSRLRAAAATHESTSSLQTTKLNSSEKLSASLSSNYEASSTGNRRVERDKSSKRKSNLNRSLNSEEVPSSDPDDVKNRRRRRRFFPQEVLDQTAAKNNLSKDDKVKSDTNLTASLLSQSSTSPNTASPTTSRLLTPRKSELSLHMENARRGIAPSFSEMGKAKSQTKRRITPPSPKDKFKSLNNSDFDSYSSDKDSSFGRSPRKPIGVENKFGNTKSSSDNDAAKNNKSISKKMEELTALTKETLARVERLASKNKELPLKQIKRPLSSSPIKQLDSPRTSKSVISDRSHHPSSILKKKILEEPIIVESVPNAAPVSILKRKVSQDDHKSEGASSSTHTPPVTFSPSVVEPATTNRKQGILKKRRSLDESQVMRHRSCSPDVANKTPDSRSILKNQRRSSLEELTRTQSPELQLHGILKRKTSRAEEEDHSLNSPQSILKRRSGASSAGSTSSTPHVSITTAVILAAARGAEMVLENSETVRPILKKKSFSDDHSYSENSYSETPKPILKKKSSTDTDECEERPKKPILKISRSSSDRENTESNLESRSFSNIKHNIPADGECDVKPILKQNGCKEEGARPRLSFCGDRDEMNGDTMIRHRSSRRSHTICAEFNVKADLNPKEEDRQLKKPRPLSVFELVMNFENTTSTGAIPKKSSLKRNSDRYRTQPVTFNELEASLNLVRSPQLENSSKLPKSSPLCSPSNHSVNSLLDFTSSLENDSHLNSFLSSHHNTSPDSGVCGKMSSDSAFQSLGDGLELDQDDDKPLESSGLELQMKAIAEEAQKIKLGKGSSGVQKYRNRKSCPSERSTSSRFSTQPVTFDEVQEASRINKNSNDSEGKDEAEPSKLSLFERIKLFNVKVKEDNPQKRDVPRRRLNRFQTQPVTSDEVETARCIPNYALDDERSGDRTPERRGILKSSFGGSRGRGDSPSPHPRSVLKKRDSFDGTSDHDSSNRRSILKTEIADVTYDEGISCNDSASDSETASAPSYVRSPEVKLERPIPVLQVFNRFAKSSSETSDGDSSGGREVRSIFKNENKLKVKQKLEIVLSKSKSQSAFGDESEFENRRGSSIRRSQTQSAMPRAIEEIQAKLQQSGESGWRRRLQQNNNSNDELKLLNMNRYNDELSEKTILEIKKDELDAASKQWKSRVEKSDAEKFSVAGRMEKNREEANLPINIPVVDNKRTPQAKRFKGKEGNDSSSTPVSPDKYRHVELTRSYSVPDPDQDSSGSDTSLRAEGRKVSVSRPDDFTFKNFYKSVEHKVTSEQIEVSLDDFDLVTRQSLLVQKKNVQVQKRRGASKNPVKALASRIDISNEYTEVITGVAERERKRLNIEKLAKSSSLAPAALAGLVSKEDFKSVALKKSTFTSSMVPYKDVMLLHVKGRQHVQTRLVEPVSSSINEGDNYILVTPTTLYNYVGKYSNVIEQSRASDIINHIQQSGDLGCKESQVVGLNVDDTSRQFRNFWKTLGCEEQPTFTSGGNPDEDGIYEANILSTNMIYKLEGNELVPLEEYWGKIPRIEMLEPTKVIVFDFGTEMYVWSGKNAPLDKKKLAIKLAKEMWELGYDYSDCNICPLNVASILGNRTSSDVSKTGNGRPSWALFAKITQHRETILFKEKFLDWPDFSRIIKVKGDQNGKCVDPSYNILPCDVAVMLKGTSSQPDLVVENLHLGRGDKYFDEETKRLYEFETLKISVWRILENHPEQLTDDSVGHFYNNDSYVIKWNFRTTVKGRELSGKPSKHLQAGRDRCVYFCWQGLNASINEKGSAALLTVELDHEKAPQIRVVQGSEPTTFLKLFDGSMVIHDGKRDISENQGRAKLFMVVGEIENEVCLIELPCEIKQLRSRTSFILIDYESAQVTIWHGCKSSEQKQMVAKQAAENAVGKKAAEFYLSEVEDVEVLEVEEGEESEEFLDAVGEDRSEYLSLLSSDLEYDFTLKMFHLSSISGTFQATEILCPHRSEHSSPFPFLQTELYSASQPALFLIDNHHELWLWQGWWPEREEEEAELSDQTGSGAVRWQAERKAAMQTAVNYWQKNHSGDESVPAFLVWAGLEPLEFRNLFPNWIERADVAELNLKEGKNPNAKLSVENQLALLSRTTYPLAELLQRPLPEGVDPTHLEIYLSSDDFQELWNMTKEEFQKLPVWKQTALKKEKGLF